MRLALIALIALAGCATPSDERIVQADAAPHGTLGGSPALGAALARARCSGCHAVGLMDESPRKNAPAFRDLQGRYPVQNLQEAFAEGVVTAHPAMPEFVFEEDEVADLIAYLESISPN